MSWRGIFFTGLLLWIASVAATALTSNTNLIPTVILLGSFLVPTTAVIWYVDHYDSPELTGALVVRAFVFGGVLGVIAAAIVESVLIPSAGWATFFVVGLIEEGAKLLALMFIARGLGTRTIRDGIVLGAAVGFGFAALESSGYAFNALLVVENGQPVGLSLSDLVFAELLRGVLAPLGHGLWTGLLGVSCSPSCRAAGGDQPRGSSGRICSCRCCTARSIPPPGLPRRSRRSAERRRYWLASG
jgi:RsiW-degrading membrane proteinase PrsW (M82 family)